MEEESEKELVEKPKSPLRDERGRFLRSGNLMGKPKGAITKFARLREDFLKVYRQMGGVLGLFAWAKEHPSEFYHLIFKLLPKEIPLPNQSQTISYEERLKLIVHGPAQGEESETSFDDVKPNSVEEEEDD